MQELWDFLDETRDRRSKRAAIAKNLMEYALQPNPWANNRHRTRSSLGSTMPRRSLRADYLSEVSQQLNLSKILQSRRKNRTSIDYRFYSSNIYYSQPSALANQ